MENLVFVPVLVIALMGFMVIGLGVIADIKAVRRKLVRDEREAIITAILAIKPLASSPDVRDTKNQIIDAITRRDGV